MTDSIGRATPIFIHSLFRAGSTYLFQAFRRSPESYWCYQEPLHEVALLSRDRPQDLLAYAGAAMRGLRHPPLDRPYFHELHETHASWHGAIAKEIIYDDYFGRAARASRTAYFNALIEAAPGRCVIQECRTSQRIEEMRADLGGTHLFLWRNPRDQWWSYKATGYFNAVTQMQINAAGPPPEIMRLREAIGFAPFHHTDVRVELAHFASLPLPPQNNYLAFFVLWWLALAHANDKAQMLVNIDALSDSPQYRADTLAQLAALGISGLAFDDCRVPQSRFDAATMGFFEEIEERAREILGEAVVQRQGVDSVAALRARHAPKWAFPASQDVAGLAQLRALVLRSEAGEAEAAHRVEAPRNSDASAVAALSAVLREGDASIAELRDELCNEQRTRQREIAEAGSTIAVMQAEQEGFREQVLRLTGVVNDERRRRREVEHEMAGVLTALDTARAECTSVIRERDGSRATSEGLRLELRAIHAGASWRLMAPLRKVANLWRRVWRGADAEKAG